MERNSKESEGLTRAELVKRYGIVAYLPPTDTVRELDLLIYESMLPNVMTATARLQAFADASAEAMARLTPADRAEFERLEAGDGG